MSARFHIQTFGCQMNASDSDWLSRALVLRGFIPSCFEEADLHILNTCSVRDKPEQKVYSELGRIARYNKVHRRKGVTVCVGGCVAQQVGDKLVSRFPEVRLMFGTDGIARAPEAISRLMEEPRLRLSLLDFAEHYEERLNVWKQEKSLSAQGLSGGDANVPVSAFVNIMQGCDNYCTYCIVPFVRGPQKSRSPEAVLNECRSLLRGGAREITLLGQNVNSYGLDKQGTSFARLLTDVGSLDGLQRLRFVTSHPKDLAPEVIDAFADLKTLCPRLHLPVQSGSDRILKAMNRRYDVVRYLDIIRSLREARPDIVLTTDIIVGFPGETEDDFQATMDIVRDVGFVSSFSFVYSDRPRAKAVLLPDKVAREVALERLSRLQELQNKASDETLSAMKGTESVILLEGPSRWDVVIDPSNDGPVDQARDAERVKQASTVAETSAFEAWQGKTPHGFTVNVSLPPRPLGNIVHGGWLGALLPVRIAGAARHSLKGRQVGTPW